VDVAGTTASRAGILARRLAQGELVSAAGHLPRAEVNGEVAYSVLDSVEIIQVDGVAFEVCSLCQHRFGSVGGSAERKALVLHLPITDSSPKNTTGDGNAFELVQWCCPGCGTAIHVDVSRREDEE
jgi:hypothetical protein